MYLKKIKPTSNSVRHKFILVKSILAKTNKIIKTQKKSFKHYSGRSSVTGHITTRHKGGGVKQSFRFINFNNFNLYGLVLSILYDPKRSSFISLNYNLISKTFYQTLATNFVFPGSLVHCVDHFNELKLGCRTLLRYIPTGSLIHSISSSYTKKSTLVRSAGTFGQIIQKDSKMCKIKLPSGILVKLSNTSYSTLGVNSNPKHNLVVYGKAGTRRLLGCRPSVRGIAMNPVDHPHGGRTNGGKPSMTPWGKPSRGRPTVNK